MMMRSDEHPSLFRRVVGRIFVRMDLKNVLPLMRPAILFAICMLAVVVRLFAVQRFEAIIHEFDPYVLIVLCGEARDQKKAQQQQHTQKI